MCEAFFLPHLLHASGDAQGTVQVASLLTPQAEYWREERAHQGAITALCWSPDGCLLASGGQDGRVRVWRAKTGALLHMFDQAAPVFQFCWSPGQQRLVAVSAGFLRMWAVPPLPCPC